MKKMISCTLVFAFLFTVSGQCFAKTKQMEAGKTSKEYQLAQKTDDNDDFFEKALVGASVVSTVATITMIVLMLGENHREQHGNNED